MDFGTLKRIGTLGAATTAALAVAACSGGGSDGGSVGGVTGFQLSSISVPEGAVWEINRPIEFRFNADVDFDSVNLNTIEILTPTGLPANGEFVQADKRTVIFQPTCPTQPDFGDAGLVPGGTSYTVRVLGGKDNGLAIQSMSGESLATSQSRSFVTPTTMTASVLFLDPVVGPPSPVIRPVGSSDKSATYLEVGNDDTSRVYFEFDPLAQAISIPQDQPVNLYSDVSTRIAFVLELNQPINPAASNVNGQNVYLEYQSAPGTFERLATEVRLLENCTETGATLRLDPRGIVPQGTRVRAVITPAFEDLVGERNLLPINEFARIDTLLIDHPTLTPSDVAADEVFESFDVSGTTFGSLEDSDPSFSEPIAIWGSGRLSAAFDFSSQGGPGGDFDLYIGQGENLILNTTTSTVFGGPDAIPLNPPGAGVDSTFQTVVNGQLNVRNLRIETGGRLAAVGPNPLLIQATGRVDIFGELTINGGSVTDVATLNTGHQPESGAAGNAGGGAGGTASFLTTTSTPKGGDAFGAFGVSNIGGKGGESAFGTGGKNNRRPGGGGGGRFGPNQGTGNGLVAEPGRDGNPNGTSAITFTKPARGGQPGNSPFIDESTTNNFFGSRFDVGTSELIVGELKAIHAGQGGGAGGDAIPNATFPSSPWLPASDEKGCGGGGGAGGLMILALNDIRVGAGGRILAQGGDGGAGENTIYNDHIGGGSGGGSGGHVVLQGARIDFTGSAADAISAIGGRAGDGQSGINSTNAGGFGGPGIIQVHVSNTVTDLIFPAGATLANRTSPDAITLSPIFGPRSRARSVWIPVGGASFDPSGAADLVEFTFRGTDPTTGLVRDVDDDDVVDELPSIFPATALVASPGLPSIAPDGRTLVVDGSVLTGDDDIYLRNPNLLKSFVLQLALQGTPSVFNRFEIANASYDSTTQQLSMTVTSAGPPLTAFTPGGTVEFTVLPRYFRVQTGTVPDSLPASATIQISFQGATEDPNGDPDPIGAFATDVATLNVPDLAFFRFDVLFDIDAEQTGLSGSSPRPSLLFTRFPFTF